MSMKLVDLTVNEFLDRLASDAPTPGGGSAAALAGAAAASLVVMVADLTLRSEKYAASHAALAPVRENAARLRHDLARLVDRDSDSYDAVVAAGKLPRGTQEEKDVRAAARAKAIAFATETPLATAEAAASVLESAGSALDAGINPNAASDIGAAAELLRAAVAAAAMNVEINLPGLKDELFVSAVRDRLARATASAGRHHASVVSRVATLLAG